MQIPKSGQCIVVRNRIRGQAATQPLAHSPPSRWDWEDKRGQQEPENQDKDSLTGEENYKKRKK